MRRPRRSLVSLFVLLALVAAGVASAGVAPPPAGAAVRCLGVCIAEVADPTVRPGGAIGLIGDSVLIGVDPWIGADLADAGWGPFHYWAGTGTRAPADNSLGAAYEIRQFRAAGFDPPVWFIGVGADDVGFVGSSVAASEADIGVVLGEIGAGRDVVMATIQHPNPVWQANWNEALHNVAARDPDLHVIEWQALADQHPEWSGGDGVHLAPNGYRARSQFITAALQPFQAAARVTAVPPKPTAVGGPATFVPVATTRVIDTRTTGGRLSAGQELSVDLSTILPAGAVAAAVNLTVDAPAADGYLTAYPCGTPPPLASNLNYGAGRPRGAAATVALDAARHLCLRSFAGADVIVDVSGAYVTAASGSRFAPVTPARLLDTRNTTALAAGAVATVSMPAGSAAATVNLTATGGAQPGYLTAYRCDQPRPVASNVNYATGQTVANLAVVPAAADGSLCIYASSSTNVIVDLLGTFGATGLRYQAATPVRVLDTRDGTGGWLGRPAAFQALDLPAVPGAQALSLTVATAFPDTDGFTTAYPCAAGRPLASNLNYTTWAAATANAVVVGAPVCVVAQARAHEIIDLAGWWVG
jgi:hypothetical protein